MRTGDFNLEKRIKEKLRAWYGGACLLSSTQKAEAGRSLSLRLSWSTDPVIGQPSRGTEEKKAGEDELNEGVMF